LLNSGNNTLTSTIHLQADAVINTQAGGLLTHSSSNLVNVPNATLTKIGAGGLEFTGSGNVDLADVHVNQGTLILDMVFATSSTAGVITGDLFIGDGVSSGATARLQRSEQINNNSTVFINNGQFDLGINGETIAGLDLTAGQVIVASS